MGTISFKGPDLSSAHPYALNNLTAAGKAISDSFTGVGTIIQDAADKHDDAITQNVLNRLSKIQNPDDIKALQQSGELDAQMQNMYNVKNQANVRDAFQNRINNIQTNTGTANAFTTTQQDFGDKQALFNTRLERDLIAADFKSRKIAEGTARADNFHNTHPNIPVVADFATQRAAAQAAIAATTEAAQKAAIEKAASMSAFNNSTAAAQSAAVAASQNTSQHIQKLENMKSGSADGATRLLAVLKNVQPDPSDYKKASGKFAEAFASNPLYRDLPTEAVETALVDFASGVGSFWKPHYWATGFVSDMKNLLDKALLENKDKITAHANNINKAKMQQVLQDQVVGDLSTTAHTGFNPVFDAETTKLRNKANPSTTPN